MTASRPSRTRGLGLVGRRIVQYALDQLIVTIPLLVLMVAVVWLFHPTGRTPLLDFLRVVLITVLVLDFAGLWFFAIWWPHRHGGQTPAMRWLRLRVVTLDGGRPPLRAYVIREVLMLVDGFVWGLAGIGLMLFTPRHQRLGDLVAGTVVVKVARAPEIEPEPGEPAESADQAALPGPDGHLGAVARP
ncbi:RDD family protein [Amycolatopsis sp. PS_44_ISF1]|uniref:RDD family protein n=1 Tax=Amycolatopsis sp. PS_44_ISF1 TaxID=2974917 RepID=UPI0028DE6749|nr:RDD family protein [Amycolatopsis sp. PS_44_ISF1]MDT8911023.1 RDD family protein [Amycolatopsis sp. PS_44_ISF1]